MKLRGKSAIITGGARGIGRGIALRFAEEGANVTIIDMREEEMIDVQKASKYLTGNIDIKKCDLSDFETTKTILDIIWDKQKKIDIVVNNAGIAAREPFIDITNKKWDQIMDVNIKAMFIVGQHISKKMIADKTGGVILNMGSKNGLAGGAQLTHYNVSKGGVNLLTQTMGVELAEYHIRVNSIAPGFIETPLDGELKQKDTNLKITERTPMRRLGTIREVANTALFLVSDESSYITGTTIVVDGGHLANASDL